LSAIDLQGRGEVNTSFLEMEADQMSQQQQQQQLVQNYGQNISNQRNIVRNVAGPLPSGVGSHNSAPPSPAFASTNAPLVIATTGPMSSANVGGSPRALPSPVGTIARNTTTVPTTTTTGGGPTSPIGSPRINSTTPLMPPMSLPPPTLVVSAPLPCDSTTIPISSGHRGSRPYVLNDRRPLSWYSRHHYLSRPRWTGGAVGVVFALGAIFWVMVALGQGNQPCTSVGGWYTVQCMILFFGYAISLPSLVFIPFSSLNMLTNIHAMDHIVSFVLAMVFPFGVAMFVLAKKLSRHGKYQHLHISWTME
jgi:hypothetical protein